MNAPVLPIVAPLFTALLLLAWWRPSGARRAAAALATALQLGIAGGLLAGTLQGRTYVLGVGRWSLELGIVLAVDPLSALMVALATLTVGLALLYGFAESACRQEHPLRLPLLQFLLTGLNLSFCTGDLFNLFVGFEVLLISSYALLTLEADDWEVKQAYPYLALNLVGSTLFICAAGLVYALAGTLNFAGLHERLPSLAGDPRLLTVGLLLLVVFTLKAGLFPLYYWLPHSYPTLPTPLAAVFAGLLTKVGVYVLVRLLGTVMPHEVPALPAVLAFLAVPTMLAGAAGALARGFIRGMLAFQVIAAVGFMVLALGWFTPLSVTACLFYLVQDVAVKSGLFFAAGVAARLNGSDHLQRMGGLWRAAPWTGIVFLILALSLAGLPPFSGFWGKLAILQAGLAGGHYAGVAALLLASVLTLLAMLRVWHYAFWRPAPAAPPRTDERRWRPMAWIAGVTAAASLAFGLAAEPCYRAARLAAERALDGDAYAAAVRAVTGKETR